MNPVNPELMSETDPTVLLRIGDPGFAAGVAKLFGTSHPNVRRAVEEFLGKNPASFDHHRLRVIAASAGVFEDQNHVAQMIRGLRPTGLEVAAKPIDLEAAREQFETSLPRQYRQETRRALVLDLVHETTLEVLENCPPERVPERGREIVRERLMRMVKGNPSSINDALVHSFANDEIATIALDRIEAKIERSEGSESDKSKLVDGHVMRDVLTYLSNATSSPSEDLYRRVWQLYGRCEPSTSVLLYASSNPVFLSLMGRSVLEALNAYETAYPNSTRLMRSARAEMLVFGELSEDVARDAVAAGVEFGDVLLTSDIRSLKRAVVRAHNYSRSAELLVEDASKYDLDRTILSIPVRDLPIQYAMAAESTSMADELAGSAYAMDEKVFEKFILNSRLSAYQLKTMVANCRSRLVPQNGRISPLAYATLNSEHDDEDMLVDVVVGSTLWAPRPLNDQSNASSEKLMLKMAACHRAAGLMVWQMLERRCERLPVDEREELLEFVGSNARSPYMQSTVAYHAARSNATRLAASLMRNGMLRAEVWNSLERLFPDVVVNDVQMRSTFPHAWEGYGPQDVARLVLSKMAPSNRAEALLNCANGQDEVMDIGRQILDADLIPDDRLVALTEAVDIHGALMVATHPRTQAVATESALVLPAEKALAETAYAVSKELGAMPPDKRLGSWKKLPNRDDEPFVLTELHHLIDGQVVDGLELRIPKTRRELSKMSAEMHNCLATYADEVAEGRRIVMAARTENDIYAASMMTNENDAAGREDAPSQTVELDQVNSKFNKEAVPASFESGLKAMITKINSGRLQRTAYVATAANDSPDSEVTHVSRVTRSPRRQRIAGLLTGVEGQPGQVDAGRLGPDAPSLLASSADAVSDVDSALGSEVDDVVEPTPVVDAANGRGLETI